MKSISKSLLVFLAVASATQAEMPSIPFGFGEDGPAGGAAVMLLSMPDVHDELALTPNQLSRLALAIGEHRRERRLLLTALLEGKVFDEPVSAADIRQIMAIHSSDFEEKLKTDLMTSKQSKRVRELTLQLKGVSSVFDPKMLEVIAASESQSNQLLSLRKKLSPQLGIQTVEDADRLLSSSLSKPQLDRLRGMQGNTFGFEVLRTRLAQSQQTPPNRYAKTQSRRAQNPKTLTHRKAALSL